MNHHQMMYFASGKKEELDKKLVPAKVVEFVNRT
jgi:hypothetical protein